MAAGRIQVGALGPPLPTSGCELDCRGSEQRVVDRRGFCLTCGAGRSWRWGRGVGGAEPWRGFPELLLLLVLESGAGPRSLGPPLFCFPKSSHYLADLMSDLGLGGNLDTPLNL